MSVRLLISSMLVTAFLTFTAWTGAHAVSLIVNGSFETGDASGWTTTGNVFIGTNPGLASDGNSSANFNGLDTAPNGVLSQAFSSVVGSEYRLSFDLGVDDSRQSAQPVLLVELLGNSLLLSHTVTDPTPTGNPLSFTGYSFLFTADSTTSTLRFSDNAGNPTQGVDLDLDNIRVEAVPEPSTLLLLGSGFVAMVALRRKSVA